MSQSCLLQQQPSLTAEEHRAPSEGCREEGVQPECQWILAGCGGDVVVGRSWSEAVSTGRVPFAIS